MLTLLGAREPAYAEGARELASAPGKGVPLSAALAATAAYFLRRAVFL